MQTKKFLHYGAMAFVTAVLALLAACGESSGDVLVNPGTGPVTPPAVIAVLSADEIAALKYMREEEKLAHDVYVALFNVWGRNVFKQIALSETTHTEAILSELVKYDIPDPAAGKAEGVFEDPALQDLYDTLIAKGMPTLIDALSVGALIEETDIRDIELRKAVTTQADILTVYNSLLSGSCNHLRAFNKQLLNQGISYVPQVITQAEWDAVVDSTSDKCGK